MSEPTHDRLRQLLQAQACRQALITTPACDPVMPGVILAMAQVLHLAPDQLQRMRIEAELDMAGALRCLGHAAPAGGSA